MRRGRQSIEDFGRATDRAGASQEGHRLSLGKVERALASYVGHAAGANQVTEALSVAFGSFALGGGVVTGVLLGVGAIVGIYEKLTEETKKAREEQDKLVKGLQDAIHLKSLGPGGITVDQVAAARAQADELKKKIDRLEAVKNAPPVSGGVMVQQADLKARADAEEQLNKLYVERQSLLNTIAGGQSMVAEAVKDAIDKETPKVKELTFSFMELRNAADKVNAEIIQEKKDWWKGYIEQTNAAISITEQLNRAANAMRPELFDVIKSFVPSLNMPTFDMPKIQMPFEGLTDAQKDQLRVMGVIKDDANKNATKLHDAIWGSAAQLAQSVVSALNLGGGGRGSNLGGAIGGTAGFAAGMFFTGGNPIGGAIGSLLGNIGGSLIGGLFDHKKAVNNNTSAIRELTAAIVQNAPTGFKVESYRYDATDVSGLARAVRRRSARGGVNPLIMGA